MPFGPREILPYLGLFVYVDAYVEPTVIPVGLVAAAPLAVVVHALYVAGHLPAVFAVLCRILIDPDPICFEPVAATFAPVSIRLNRSPHGQHQASGQRGGQTHASP
jgi:hypothetical protein